MKHIVSIIVLSYAVGIILMGLLGMVEAAFLPPDMLKPPVL